MIRASESTCPEVLAAPSPHREIAEALRVPIEPIALRPDRPVPAWQFRAWVLLAPRLPRWALRLTGRIMLRLPLGSRARRRFVLNLSRIAWDATARTRFDLVLPIWDPACEWRWDPIMVGLGFDPVYRGHEGVRRSLRNWNENWTEVAFTVREILDGGDTWLLRMTASGCGALSGAPVRLDVSSVARLDPLIVSFHNFAHDADALREAGFAPNSEGAGAAP